MIGERIFSNVKCKKYRQVGLSKNGKEIKYYIHRLVAGSFIENKNNYPQINHKDGVPTNNISDNLEWCTRKENLEHAARTGLMAGGEKNPSSKLTEVGVIKIRQMHSIGKFTFKKLADLFIISPSVIGDIVYRRTWKKVKI